LNHLQRKVERAGRGETGNPATDNPKAAANAMYEQILLETNGGVGTALQRARQYATQILARVREAERDARVRAAAVVVKRPGGGGIEMPLLPPTDPYPTIEKYGYCR
jgi:hypothetical protein